MLASAARPERQAPGPGKVDGEPVGVELDTGERLGEGDAAEELDGVGEGDGVVLGVPEMVGVRVGVRLGVGDLLGDGSAEGATNGRVFEKLTTVICGSPSAVVGTDQDLSAGLWSDSPTVEKFQPPGGVAAAPATGSANVHTVLVLYSATLSTIAYVVLAFRFVQPAAPVAEKEKKLV